MNDDRPCLCDRFEAGQAFVRGRDCPRCWLWHHNPRYRETIGRTGVGSKPMGYSEPPCRFLGPVVDSSTCGCKSRTVHQCLHDEAAWDLCTLGPNARPGEVGDCSSCPLRELVG